MRKVILMAIVALGLATSFTACERNDYQHPMHRK